MMDENIVAWVDNLDLFNKELVYALPSGTQMDLQENIDKLPVDKLKILLKTYPCKDDDLRYYFHRGKDYHQNMLLDLRELFEELRFGEREKRRLRMDRLSSFTYRFEMKTLPFFLKMPTIELRRNTPVSIRNKIEALKNWYLTCIRTLTDCVGDPYTCHRWIFTIHELCLVQQKLLVDSATSSDTSPLFYAKLFVKNPVIYEWDQEKALRKSSHDYAENMRKVCFCRQSAWFFYTVPKATSFEENLSDIEKKIKEIFTHEPGE